MPELYIHSHLFATLNLCSLPTITTEMCSYVQLPQFLRKSEHSQIYVPRVCDFLRSKYMTEFFTESLVKRYQRAAPRPKVLFKKHADFYAQ
jgi:hypothetical protein